jgi:hypothetical protein
MAAPAATPLKPGDEPFAEKTTMVAAAPAGGVAGAAAAAGKNLGKKTARSASRSSARNAERMRVDPHAEVFHAHGNFTEHDMHAHEEATKVKNVDSMIIGPHKMSTWYYSPLPTEYDK